MKMKVATYILVGIFSVGGFTWSLISGRVVLSRGASMSKKLNGTEMTNSEQSQSKQESAVGNERWSFYMPYDESQKPYALEGDISDSEPGNMLTHEEMQAFEEYRDKASSMWQALRRGDTATMRKLLEEGFDVNDSDDEDATLLHHAARAGQNEVAQLLLDYGANINAQDLYGHTPLMLAAEGGHTTIELLKAAGAYH